MFSEPYIREYLVDASIGTSLHGPAFCLVVVFCKDLHLLQFDFPNCCSCLHLCHRKCVSFILAKLVVIYTTQETFQIGQAKVSFPVLSSIHYVKRAILTNLCNFFGCFSFTKSVVIFA